MRNLLILISFGAATLFAVDARANPSFSVHKNGTDQAVTASTNTMLTWSTEVFDTNNNFATNRFTPTTAGKYLIVVSARCAQPGMCIPSIYKNGTLYAQTQWTNHNFADQAPQATAIIDMNGTTDYVEAFIFSTGTVIGGTSDRTYFSGSKVDGSGGGGTPAGTVAGAVQFRGSTAVFAADDANLIWDDTNNRLGIGTTTPSTALDVNGLITGGFGTANTGGTLDWNDATNARSGSGYTLLRAVDSSNAPPAATNSYFHPFSFEYVHKNGTGNLTQFAIPYGLAASLNEGMFVRGRYLGTWTGWYRFIVQQPSGNVGIGSISPASKLIVTHAGNVGHADTSFVSDAPNLAAGSGYSARFRSYSGADHLVVRNDGNVGIGTTSPVYTLDITGNVRATAYLYTSDERLKANVRTLSGLDIVSKLHGVSFEWKNTGKAATGVIAQEVESVLPAAVSTDDNGNKSVDYPQLIGPLIEAVKELKAANDELREEINTLKRTTRETH